VNGLIGKSKKHRKYVCGFTTIKGLLLDLDNTTLKESSAIAEFYCKRFRLKGYLIARSSENNYHVVFNRYLTWKKTLEYLFKIVWRYHYHEHGMKPSLTYWAILQACKGSETLRISKKNHKAVPKVVRCYGETDKLCRDYMEYVRELND
jgi:FMN phosphatase YigB (HAD superfamily)